MPKRSEGEVDEGCIINHIGCHGFFCFELAGGMLSGESDGLCWASASE